MTVPTPCAEMDAGRLAALPAALWRSIQPTIEEISAARRRLHLKAVVIFLLVAGSYWTLVVSDFAPVFRLVAAAALVFGVVAVGTGVMHDANHGSFSSHPWLNRLLAYTSDALGASSWLWRIQHNNLHHANTNVAGHDADIELAPWARLAPTQPWRRRYRFQHLYIWPLYGFLALKNLLVSDLVSLVKGQVGSQPLAAGKRRRIVVRTVAGKLGHGAWAILIPLLFNPWWTVLLFYLACSWLVGFVLAVVFQLAHCVDATEMVDPAEPRRGAHFVTHQLRTTANIGSRAPVVSRVFRWVVGGLDHQIEHHLAPRLPHTIYPLLATRFRRLCSLNQVEYRRHHSVWSALCSHTRWLREMGSQPALSMPCSPSSGRRRTSSPRC